MPDSTAGAGSPGRHPASEAFDLPAEARAAIEEGIARGDAVAELEYLGFTLRNINILEDSKFRITTLEQLLSRRRQELLEIPSFGASGLGDLLRCLARYHLLDEAKQELRQRHLEVRFTAPRKRRRRRQGEVPMPRMASSKASGGASLDK